MWRQWAIAPSYDLLVIPPCTIRPEMLAVLPSFLAASKLLEDYGSLKPGDLLIQSGADTLTGQAIIQLCRILQIKTINLIADDENFEETADTLNGLGATYVWRNKGSVKLRLEKAHIPKPRVGIDAHGGSTLQRISRCSPRRQSCRIVRNGNRDFIAGSRRDLPRHPHRRLQLLCMVPRRP